LSVPVYQHRRHTTANIQHNSTFSEKMLRNTVTKDLGPFCPARPQHSPSLPSFRALTVYTPRLSCLKECPRRLQHARVRPGQQAQPLTSTERAPRIFCLHPSLPSQDSSPSCSSLTFERTSSQFFPQDTSPSCSGLTFGLLRTTASRFLFFGRLQRTVNP